MAVLRVLQDLFGYEILRLVNSFNDLVNVFLQTFEFCKLIYFEGFFFFWRTGKVSTELYCTVADFRCV